jgi:hypothetical protein
MFKPAASFLAFALLAGCSGNAERVGTSSEALSLVLENLSVTPTDTTITIAYEAPGPILGVTLGGQTQNATVVTGGTQNQSVVFSGLSPCTSYGWSIPAASGTVTGQTNTRYPGGAACPTTEPIYADELWQMKAMEHQEEQNLGCGNWTYDWPIGSGWRFVQAEDTTDTTGFTGTQFGYEHFSNGSSFCAESAVTCGEANSSTRSRPGDGPAA